MAETFLYLTTTGRISGELRTIEIWFVEHAGDAYIVAEHRDRAQWVRNLMANPACSFSIGDRDNRESLRPLRDAVGRTLDPARDAALHQEVTSQMQAKYGWSNGLVVQLHPADTAG